MKRLLIVEDEDSMAIGLRDGFSFEGYQVTLARDGSSALQLASEQHFDLIILDVMLPRLSGFDLCKQLRRSGNSVPIILLTARGQEIDKVLGLKLGADDYVTKPFSFMELSARVEAVLRRTTQQFAGLENFEFGDVVIDFKRSTVSKKGQPVDLTAREFNLLKYLVEHRGEVVTREQLLSAVWGYNSLPVTRTVDTHVAKLRQKIEDPETEPHYIITVHRAGYKFIG